MSEFSDLPVDIFYVVFEYLEVSQLLSYRRVNKKWNEMIINNRNENNRKLILLMYKGTIRKFNEKVKNIDGIEEVPCFKCMCIRIFSIIGIIGIMACLSFSACALGFILSFPKQQLAFWKFDDRIDEFLNELEYWNETGINTIANSHFSFYDYDGFNDSLINEGYKLNNYDVQVNTKTSIFEEDKYINVETNHILKFFDYGTEKCKYDCSSMVSDCKLINTNSKRVTYFKVCKNEYSCQRFMYRFEIFSDKCHPLKELCFAIDFDKILDNNDTDVISINDQKDDVVSFCHYDDEEYDTYFNEGECRNINGHCYSDIIVSLKLYDKIDGLLRSDYYTFGKFYFHKVSMWAFITCIVALVVTFIFSFLCVIFLEIILTGGKIPVYYI